MLANCTIISQVAEGKLVAASETGRIYFYSIQNGKLLQTFPLRTRVSITSLLVVKEGLCAINMYIGTFRDYLQVYSFDSYHYVKAIPVGDTIECMDAKWGYIFIGCVSGWLHRYSIVVSLNTLRFT